MNNQQRKYIPASDALPTRNYWIAFIIVAIILCFVNYNNARADIANYNDNLLLEDISEAEENKILTATLVDSVITYVFACAWGIILNIALRYKTWRWRWVLIYAVTVTALAIGISSLANGKLTAGSVGWIWWAIIGLYRREYVNTHLKYAPQSEAPSPSFATTSTSSSNNIFSHVVCTMCGKKIQPGDKFCEHCGAVVNPQKKTTATTPKTVHCEKCGTYYISAPRCSFCGAENKKYFPPHVIVKEETYILSNQSEPASDLSAYHSAFRSLLDGICPQTTAEAFEDYLSKPRKRVAFECKCFLSFLHHLATREDVYSEINTDTYIAKFNIPTDERNAFNSRICDYLEIDMGGNTLPYMNVLLDKLEPSEAEKARSCEAINYIYAFTVFSANAKTYVAKRDFDAFANLSFDTYNSFLDNSSVKYLLFAVEIYQQLKDSTNK